MRGFHPGTVVFVGALALVIAACSPAPAIGSSPPASRSRAAPSLKHRPKSPTCGAAAPAAPEPPSAAAIAAQRCPVRTRRPPDDGRWRPASPVEPPMPPAADGDARPPPSSARSSEHAAANPTAGCACPRRCRCRPQPANGHGPSAMPPAAANGHGPSATPPRERPQRQQGAELLPEKRARRSTPSAPSASC